MRFSAVLPRPPRLTWRGPAREALRRLERLDNDAGVALFWSAFRCGIEGPPDVMCWQSHLGFDPREDEWLEAFVFCPACAEREFED